LFLSPLSLLRCLVESTICCNVLGGSLLGSSGALLGGNARSTLIPSANAKRTESDAPDEYGDV